MTIIIFVKAVSKEAKQSVANYIGHRFIENMEDLEESNIIGISSTLNIEDRIAIKKLADSELLIIANVKSDDLKSISEEITEINL